jgi:hypothetical protein
MFSFIRKTWFWEQLPAFVLVAFSTHRAGGFNWALSLEALVGIWASVVVTIAGIKMQSISAREAEEFREAHPDAAELAANQHVQCHAAKARYSIIVQFGGLFSRLITGDPYGFALALRAALYGLWRRFYVARRAAKRARMNEVPQ